MMELRPEHVGEGSGVEYPASITLALPRPIGEMTESDLRACFDDAIAAIKRQGCITDHRADLVRDAVARFYPRQSAHAAASNLAVDLMRVAASPDWRAGRKPADPRRQALFACLAANNGKPLGRETLRKLLI